MRPFPRAVAILVVLLTYVRLKAADELDEDMDFDFDSEDIVHSIKGAMNTLFEYMGNEDGCYYTCANGAKPVRNTRHTPHANGCGSFGIKLDMSQVPAIEKCCDKHDVCYDTCNQAKATCDDEFRDCLTDICKAMNKIVSSEIYSSCKSTADMMYAATLALGCKPYRDSQKAACLCPKTNIEL